MLKGSTTTYPLSAKVWFGNS